MVLFTVCGELGAGKTCSMTFLTWKNWYFKNLKIFSNYNLFKLPYYYVNSLSSIEQAEDGIFAIDELWRLSDARSSRSNRNRFVSNVLASSRKKNLTVLNTVQIASSVDKRIRDVTDFTALPSMNTPETICQLLVFRSGYAKAGNIMHRFYYKTAPIYQLYDTNQIITEMSEEQKPMPLVFQENFNREHGYLCECKDCGTKFFDNWDEANAYAREYWRKVDSNGIFTQQG